jgi:hypothetical protein
MPELKFAVAFSAVDHLSDTFSRIGEGLMELGNRAQEAGERLGSLGERMIGFGERTGLTAALVSEGADRLHEWSEAMQEPAQDMQKNMATMAAMTGLAGEALEKIKARAIDFAATDPGAAVEEWIAGFAGMRGIFQDTAQAMRAEDTVAMLKRLGVESDAATRLIQVGWSNLRTAAPAVGDQLTRAIQAFGLNPGDANNFAMAVGRLGASAAAARTPFSEVLSLAGEANGLLGGGRGAAMFASMIQQLEEAAAKGKATIDFSHGLVAALQQLQSQLSGTSAQKLAALAGMGLGAQGPQLLKLLDNLDEVKQKQKQIADSSGALAKAYGTATDNMADATVRLHQNWSNLADALITPALGIQARWTNFLSDSIAALSRHIEHHSEIASAATLALTGLGGAAYHGVQALFALGTMWVFTGQGLKAAQWAIKALDFESMALRFMYAKDAIAGIVNITRIWTGVQWALNLAMSVNPFYAIIAGAALLAAGIYALAKYTNFFQDAWAGLKRFGAGIERIFSDVADWMKTAGLNMMKWLGEGILAGVEYPFKSAWQVAEKVGGLFHFHSPPDEGPLRDAVLNFRFGEELAARMQPAPIVGAASKMATGIVAPVVRAEPIGQASAGRAGAGNTIHIHYSPHINVTGGPSAKDEWVKAARQHADELVRIIRGKLQREARLSFT